MSRRRARKDGIQDFASAVEERLARANGPASGWDIPGDDDAVAGDDLAMAPRARIGQLLVERGEVDSDELQDALAEQATSGLRIGEIMMLRGHIDERSLASVLAEQFGFDTIELSRTKLDHETVELLEGDDARRLCAIAVRRDGDRVEIAVGDPVIDDLKHELITQVHAPVRLLVAPRSEVVEALDRFYQDTGAINDALRDFQERFGARRRPGDGLPQHVAVDENAPVVRVVNLIFEHAVRDRASDVHIEPRENRVRVRVRTDGALHEIMTLPAAMGVPLVSRLKVMAEMNIVERRRPQDGQLEVKVDGRDLDVRVSTSATLFGEKCVLRLLDKTRAFLDLTELGMTPETLEGYRELIRSPYGMVICAGPTGSGKTTSLYATLAAIENDELNVVTIEDPVEYIFPNINQIQINEQAGITFANGLKSILRQDPDAILVGEIRDIDTVRIAVQAALTGHFVMSSLHATDATSALHRFMDMGIEPFLVASSLLGVVGQRLVRKVCRHCAEPYEPPVDELAFFHESGGGTDKSTFLRGAGCSRCGHTGYFERVGVYEVLAVSDTMKELIVANASLAELRATARREGMQPLRRQAAALVERDETTIAEVLRTVYVL